MMSQRLSATSSVRTDTYGLAAAIASQTIWGFISLYWRLLSGESALFVLTSRMVWSCVFIVLLCVFVTKVHFLSLFKDTRALIVFISASMLTTLNWGVYIWAANSGHLIETSIGYYLCPLFNILFGLVVFHERLTRMQKIAVICAVLGVGYFVSCQNGLIWISLILAFSFAAYGAVKKKGGYPALAGMAIESILTGAIGLSILAAGIVAPWIWTLVPATPDPMAINSQPAHALLLVTSGIITAIPLVLYSTAANRVPMIMIGFLQYIAPTIALWIAVGFFGEAFTFAHAICFGLVWLGIALMSAETVIRLNINKSHK